MNQADYPITTISTSGIRVGRSRSRDEAMLVFSINIPSSLLRRTCEKIGHRVARLISPAFFAEEESSLIWYFQVSRPTAVGFGRVASIRFQSSIRKIYRMRLRKRISRECDQPTRRSCSATLQIAFRPSMELTVCYDNALCAPTTPIRLLLQPSQAALVTAGYLSPIYEHSKAGLPIPERMLGRLMVPLPAYAGPIGTQ